MALGEPHVLCVDGAWKEIGEWRAPFLCRVGQSTVLCRFLTEARNTYNLDVLGNSGVEQDQAHVRMLDQDGHDDHVADLVLWVFVACTAAVGATQESAQCEI